MCRVSVIIPIYNAEKFLHRCIDSIIAQTFINWELLLIDDGSKDSSGRICDEYVAKDERIHVFHKENGGVSSARNLGIDHAKGQYIVFVDSDDWVDNDYLECLLPESKEDLICCSFEVEDSYKRNNWNVLLADSYKTREALKKNLTRFAFCSVTCKSFKKSLIQAKNVRFNEKITQCEDGLFVFDYLSAIRCAVRTKSKCCYHYRWDSKERNVYKCYPMEQSYLLLKLLTERLDAIRDIYQCPNAAYLQHEMLCSQIYNIYRTIKVNESSLFKRISEYIKLLKNDYVRNLLMDKSFMRNRRHGIVSYCLMKTLYFFYWGDKHSIRVKK